MTFKNIIIHLCKGFYTSFLICCVSCSDDSGSLERGEGDFPVKIGANINKINTTRSYQPSGDVESGEFFFSYIDKNNHIEIAAVNFVNGVGEISIDGSNSLEWKDIGYNADSNTVSTFYLDNVPNDRGEQSETIVTFTDDYHPFVADVLDTEDGSNDLLWGVREIARNSPVVNFQLHHCMSLLNIELTVEKESDVLLEKDLDIENAAASISNILKEPVTFNRQNGRLDFAVDETTGQPDLLQYEKLTLVDETTNLGWQDIQRSKIEGKEISVYKSKDFVLPPQELLSDINRPRLSISFPTSDGVPVVYSGVIPRAMEVRQPDGSTLPMALSFLRGYCLTLHIRLSLNPVEIIFMPVTVVDWVNKGSALITADQAGVNDESDFLKLLNVISNPEDSKLERFGYKDEKNKNWVFNIFTELTFDLREESYAGTNLRGVLKNNPLGDFSFSMHHWKITIIDVNGDKYVLSTSEELVSFLIDGELK